MGRDARMLRSNPRWWRVFPGLVVLLVAGSCSVRNLPPPSPPVPPDVAPSRIDRPHPGYDARVDSLQTPDLAALAGRRIALDPGHGGHFRGALGVHGLAEAEVNLAVALELERLLREQGAEVFLTRRTNEDFLTPADSSLRADLTERMRRANAFAPDFFLSIHHNADPGGARDRNEIQTYYKLGDEGPSLDAAASLHRMLKRNLAIEKQRIVPGNYFVLRHSDAPGVLTEASYITNPDVESRLRLPEKQRLEAEALLLGLARFFARGAPEVSSFVARGPGGRTDTLFTEIDAPRLEALVDGAFDLVHLEVAGREVEPLRAGSRLEWQAVEPLPSGRHEARLRVARAGGGAARERRLSFVIERRPATLRAGWMSPAGGGGARIEVVDRAGLHSAEPLRVRAHALKPGILPRDTVLTARDGVAWGYFRSASGSVRGAGPAVRFTAADTGVRISATTLAWPWPPPGDTAWSGVLRLMPADQPLRETPATREPAPAVRWLNRDGFAALPSRGGVAMPPRLDGYRAWGATDAVPPRLTMVAGGVLQGRRIVLDPDAGGEESGGMGSSGTRAALHNLEVARALADYLTAAGARVRMARTGDNAVSDVERVRLAEAFAAERYLRIGHRPEPPRLGHYFSSAAGRRWAGRTARWLDHLGLGAPPVAEDAQYPLQQVSAVALYAGARRVDDPGSETRMNEPGAARILAYALYLGLLDDLRERGGSELDSLFVRDSAGVAVPGALVRLGGAIVLAADNGGRVRFARTEPGPIEVDLLHPELEARSVLLDSARGAVMTGLRRR